MHTQAPLIAAIDLGSNSFHLRICRWRDGQLLELERQKTLVQLARGMSPSGQLCPQAEERAHRCLQDFRQRLAAYPDLQVAVVATQAVRQCRDSQAFIRAAEVSLGHPIQVISAEREAQLVYRGVQATLPAGERDKRILVVDIGGASTELIIGQQTAGDGVFSEQEILRWHSLPLGCVGLADRFFGGSPDPAPNPAQATFDYCCQQLAPWRDDYNADHWQLALGASGTMRVLAQLLASPAAETINTADLQQLSQRLSRGEDFGGQLSTAMREVLPAGVALLQALFHCLNFDVLNVSPGSIKEGLMLEALQ